MDCAYTRTPAEAGAAQPRAGADDTLNARPSEATRCSSDFVNEMAPRGRLLMAVSLPCQRSGSAPAQMPPPPREPPSTAPPGRAGPVAAAPGFTPPGASGIPGGHAAGWPRARAAEKLISLNFRDAPLDQVLQFYARSPAAP